MASGVRLADTMNCVPTEGRQSGEAASRERPPVGRGRQSGEAASRERPPVGRGRQSGEAASPQLVRGPPVGRGRQSERPPVGRGRQSGEAASRERPPVGRGRQSGEAASRERPPVGRGRQSGEAASRERPPVGRGRQSGAVPSPLRTRRPGGPPRHPHDLGPVETPRCGVFRCYANALQRTPRAASLQGTRQSGACVAPDWRTRQPGYSDTRSPTSSSERRSMR